MQDESTPKTPMRDFGDMERDVVYLLTDPSRQPTVWLIADIGREIDDDTFAASHRCETADLSHVRPQASHPYETGFVRPASPARSSLT
jgi:hypothetical protein